MPSDPTRRPPDAFLPLKPVEVLVLTMLTAGERHGYGIRQDIIDHTEGAMQLEAGCEGKDAQQCLDTSLAATYRRPFAATSTVLMIPKETMSRLKPG